MIDPILGTLSPIPSMPEDFKGTFEYQDRRIDLILAGDGKPIGEPIRLAHMLIHDLDNHDKTAKAIIARDLLDTYNSGWNEYITIQEDGTELHVSNPKLSQSSFIAKLHLDAINVTGDNMIDLYYDDSRLFWGHAVVVTSFDGVKFENAKARIEG